MQYININTKQYVNIKNVVVITTGQLHSTKPELRFCAGSNPARNVSEICDGEDLWQWSRLEIRLNAFRRSIIPQKQFIIITPWFVKYNIFFIVSSVWYLFLRLHSTLVVLYTDQWVECGLYLLLITALTILNSLVSL